jgi:hypothetical protein
MLMVLLCAALPPPVQGQEKSAIHLTARGEKLGEILEAFQWQSGIRLVFVNSMVDSFFVTGKIADPPAAALRKILLGTPFDFIQPRLDLWVIVPRSPTASLPASLAGVIVDAATQQPIEAANVFLPATPLGTTTDFRGYFKIEGIAPSRYDLTARRIGYQDSTVELTLWRNTHKNLQLTLIPKPLSVPEIIVESAYLSKPAGAFLSQQTVAANQLALPPVRNDGEIFEILHQQPGVSRRDLDDVFPHIEGGSATEVAVELDGMPIFVPTYGENRRSVFAAPIIANVTLHRAGYGPQLGEAMSGVVGLQTRDVAELAYSTRASVSLSGLTFSAKKNFSRWRWLGIGRSANFNGSFKPGVWQAHDLLNKFEYQISKQQKLTLLSLVSRGDLMQSNSQTPLKALSHGTGLRYSARTDSSQEFSGLFYHSALSNRQQESGFKLDLQKQLSNVFSANAGLHFFHLQSHGAAAVDSVGKFKYVWISFLDYDPRPVKIFEQSAVVLSPYWGLKAEKKLWRWQIGWRLPANLQNRLVRIEPRATLTFTPAKNFGMTLAGGRYHQFTDRSYATEAKSGDAIGAGEYVVRSGGEPSRATHLRGEISYQPRSAWEMAMAIFRKDYHFAGQYYLYRLNRAVWLLPLQRGESDGLEFWLGKVFGRSQGWMSYTFNRETYISAPGASFRPYFNRRHLFNLAFLHHLTGNWQLKGQYAKAGGFPGRDWASDYLKIQPAITPEEMARRYLVEAKDFGAHTQLAVGLSRQFIGPAQALAVDFIVVNTLQEKYSNVIHSDFKFWLAVHVSH